MKYLSDIPNDLLLQLHKYGQEIHLHLGDSLDFRSHPGSFYVVIEGEIQLVVEDKSLISYQSGEVIRDGGFLGKATSPCRLLHLSTDKVQDILAQDSTLSEALISAGIGQPLDGKQLQQQDKLATLGKLSAGIIHELKNPAAAAERAAEQLRDRVLTSQSLTLKLQSYSLTNTQLELLVKLSQDIKATPTVLDPIEQSDHEDEVTDWLEDQGIENAWEITPTLVEAGVTLSQLESLAEIIPTEALSDALYWLESTLDSLRFVSEIEQSATRLLDLIGAVKANAHLGKSSRQAVDLHESLENALKLLHHKLKGGITVKRDYDPHLPSIPAYSGELHQVWTNLIDNAADAMNGQGTIKIRTFSEEKYAIVEIADNGIGIPPEIQNRVFEQFFTTKEVGKGTGLGLDIVRRIIVEQHQGDIQVRSQPGETCFQIRLPLS